MRTNQLKNTVNFVDAGQTGRSNVFGTDMVRNGDAMHSKHGNRSQPARIIARVAGAISPYYAALSARRCATIGVSSESLCSQGKPMVAEGTEQSPDWHLGHLKTPTVAILT